MRQLILDTETTGLDPTQGHRLIEIACVEMVNRRLTGQHFHYYLNPDREVEAGAFAIHGLSNEFLADKPRFTDISAEFMNFIQGAELIIHNAPFDVGFLEHELRLINHALPIINQHCSVIDTLSLARKLHPGQKNNLDALCKRYNIDNSNRQLHGALLDSELLALVYLAMTGGQTSLFGAETTTSNTPLTANTTLTSNIPVSPKEPLSVIYADTEELTAHQAYLEKLASTAESGCVWLNLSQKK